MVTKGAGLIFKGSGFYETDYKRKERDFGKRNGSGKYLKKEEHEPSHKQPAVNDKKQSVTENS